jgi:Arc/MetJ-type ribon-helix-helix transcriptional regulator
MAKKYRTVSLPLGLAEDIQGLIDELGYWPSVGAFVREATVEKVKEWKNRLKETGSPTL